MITILVLGHKGMLGNAVVKYFKLQPEYVVYTVDSRWCTDLFKNQVATIPSDYIINCIGAIPQRHPLSEEYLSLNVELPTYLETLGKKIIHPTTDCEFSGVPKTNFAYTKQDIRNATDDYGKSKAIISKRIENEFTNTKIIRVSIIGHELNSHLSLLDWFLSSENEIKGYTNHYWNGITTLEWAKIAHKILENWESYPSLNQYGTHEHVSKYRLLCLIKELYNKQIIIHPFETAQTINKCLTSDAEIPSLRTQIAELKSFYIK